MKKFLLALVVLSGTAYGALAQTSEPGKFSVGVEAGLPLGDAGDAFNFAIGGSLKYELPVAEQFSVSLSAGYTNLMYKGEVKDALEESGESKSGIGFIPVKAGAKYYFNGSFNEGFFGEAQLGATFSTEEGGGTAFTYAPGVGYSFGNGLETGLRYEAWSNDGTISQLGLRIAYKF
ncbi:DUF3575 domain-containing protein [Mucilaginibacter limnophilus]|uniref:DUF3575 domain-containing protein n=1 Tax=Mucilaginibacter limnophilus TaxID=1932778 RepID=A0A437MRC0_9SPHI|nr:outer membrane beta-barrel protein [Mucilaginibacter limnophilus]RVU00186.1 DUF3575 domain-containing protein [Mucilaginibacter limnophilus]